MSHEPFGIEKRFWPKVEKTKSCWLWRGAKTNLGYGQLTLGRREEGKRGAHRISWELHFGTIPLGMTIDHLCRNRACVNPDHLEPVTMRENILRGNGASAHNTVKTHCAHGHPFDEINTYKYTYKGKNRRMCRQCARIRVLSYYHARKREPKISSNGT